MTWRRVGWCPPRALVHGILEALRAHRRSPALPRRLDARRTAILVCGVANGDPQALEHPAALLGAVVGIAPLAVDRLDQIEEGTKLQEESTVRAHGASERPGRAQILAYELVGEHTFGEHATTRPSSRLACSAKSAMSK